MLSAAEVALLVATLTGWLHHLTATTCDGRLVRHGARGDQAMIATLLSHDPGWPRADSGRLTRLPLDFKINDASRGISLAIVSPSGQ